MVSVTWQNFYIRRSFGLSFGASCIMYAGTREPAELVSHHATLLWIPLLLQHTNSYVHSSTLHTAAYTFICFYLHCVASCQRNTILYDICAIFHEFYYFLLKSRAHIFANLNCESLLRQVVNKIGPQAS